MDHALRQAIEQGNPRAILAALAGGANIELADIHGWPGLPLRSACFIGNVDVVSLLIERGANIHAANEQGPGGPLRTARRAGHPAIVELLLAHGATDAHEQAASAPADHDRRQRGERRRHRCGPPNNLPERRGHEQRRVTLVQEVALPEALWERYFSQTLPAAKGRGETDEHQDAALILARARD